jgi:hypothetical protein
MGVPPQIAVIVVVVVVIAVITVVHVLTSVSRKKVQKNPAPDRDEVALAVPP